MSFGGKAALFLGGVLFGSAGLRILSGRDARKVYTHATAATLRCKDEVMRQVELVQEGCSDILADARAINEARAAEDAKYIEDTAKIRHDLPYEIDGIVNVHIREKLGELAVREGFHERALKLGGHKGKYLRRLLLRQESEEQALKLCGALLVDEGKIRRGEGAGLAAEVGKPSVLEKRRKGSRYRYSVCPG